MVNKKIAVNITPVVKYFTVASSLFLAFEVKNTP
jgi:hypothetical protein